MNQELIKKLTDARYKILVACRPLQPAKYAFNVTVDAILSSVELEIDEETLKAIESLKLLD